MREQRSEAASGAGERSYILITWCPDTTGIVAAVAFFAAWSVLSNTFCALLLLTTRPFRVGDYIEVVESGEKPGLRGTVTAIHLIYTTLTEHESSPANSVLHIPNSLFFQRIVRRTSAPAEDQRDARMTMHVSHEAGWGELRTMRSASFPNDLPPWVYLSRSQQPLAHFLHSP